MVAIERHEIHRSFNFLKIRFTLLLLPVQKYNYGKHIVHGSELGQFWAQIIEEEISFVYHE